MKKQLLLTRMLLLVALLVGSVSVWGATATFDWTSTGNMGTKATGKVNDITLTGAANSASNAPAVTSNTLRIYAHRSSGNGASATFTADDGYKISEIEVTSSNGGTILKYSADGGGFTGFSFSEGVATVSDLNVSSITLKNCQNSGSSNTTIQISKVVITYASSGSTPSSGAAFTYSSRSMDLKDATSFTQTATTADGYAGTDGASVTYSMTANTAGANINASTGEVTPTKAGSVTVQASAAAIAGKYSASSATYTLTVTDTRVFTVTCHTGDDSENIDRNSGATLSLGNPAPKYGMSFVGWSSTNNIANPTWVENTTIVTGDMELYAMYEAVAGEYSYHLVEADQSDWRGDYLIAYSSTIFADGRVGGTGTGGIGAANVKVNPESNLSGKVVDVDWGDTYKVTFEAKDDADLSEGYVLKTQDGNYNYQTSNSNGLTTSKNKATAATYAFSVTFTSSSDIKLKLSGAADGAVFRYNTDGYFRFYKNGGQDPVYLYKRTEDVAPVYSLGISLGTEETVTIGSSKYASYCSSNSLDFSETDVKAYKAKVDEDKVVLTQVDYVPANTGVILYCATANDYDVPVISNAAAVSDNEMVGVTVETTVVWNPSTDVYNYILQQGVFNKAAEAGAKLRANRAYLSTAYNVTAPGSKPLTIVFNDDEQGEETDGIKAVSSTVENGVRYNLAGQRVGNDYKGIVIVNGKKMLNK